jgi:maltose O-acetyltransferase
MEYRVALRTEQDKMLAGELYHAADPELVAGRARAREACERFAATRFADAATRTRILRELLGGVGADPEVEAPFTCDYGSFTFLGDGVFVNFGCVILDSARVQIGDRTMLGPGVHIYTATHNVEPEVRRSGLEFALPVTIGSDVWIGGRVTIGPGVTVGDGSTLGAGSVVLRDVPPRTVVAGNPARVIRTVPPADGDRPPGARVPV